MVIAPLAKVIVHKTDKCHITTMSCIDAHRPLYERASCNEITIFDQTRPPSACS